MKLKNLLFLLIIGSLFACNKESDDLALVDNEEDIELRRAKETPCNPNINFPLSYPTMTSPGQMIDPDGECGDYTNYTTTGSSPLEDFFDCKFDNLPVIVAGEFECESFVIPLYDYCADFGDYFLYPSEDPSSDNPYSLYLDQDLLNNGASVVTEDDFNVITDYAHSVIQDILGGFPNGFVEVDFFLTPYDEDCIINCNTVWNNGVNTITNTYQKLYMKVKVCKEVGGPQIGVSG